jgi:hypothetical protein
MPPREPLLVVPTAIGRAALADLSRVPWGELAHANGRGRAGTALHEDVPAALSMVGDGDRTGAKDGLEALFSSLSADGQVFEATAYAVPFLAALIAHPRLPAKRARGVGVLLGSVAIASSFEAAEIEHEAGSPPPATRTPAEATREALRACEALFHAAGRAHPTLRRLLAGLDQLLATDAATDSDRERLGDLLEAAAQEEAYEDGTDDEDGENDGNDRADDDENAEEEEDEGENEDVPPAPPPPPPTERVSHPKFGPGLVLGREGDKLRVRFDDGPERVLLTQFVKTID